MLTSLEIKNFRTFSHVAIERLARVNLIFGKNNVGKTTLLEALRIIGSTRPAEAILSILHARNEVRASADLASYGERKPHYAIESLLYGRRLRSRTKLEIIAHSSTVHDYEVSGEVMLDGASEVCVNVTCPLGVWILECDGSAHLMQGFDISPLDLPASPPPLVDIPGAPETESMVGSWWDDVWLPSGRERVLELLKTVAPIEDLIFVRDPRSQHARMAKAQVKDVDEPLVLAAMGAGVVRLLHIALAMEYAARRAEQAAKVSEQTRDTCAFLLIDEVDSGIHHSLHAQLWRFVFNAARQLDIQVFATTHSWDCLRGFAEAVTEDEENDGLAIRLEKVEGEEQTGAVIIDRDALPVVVRDSIEVR
jgi:energy-coupling factor transporter ATP-binding protein EcfA2